MLRVRQQSDNALEQFINTKPARTDAGEHRNARATGNGFNQASADFVGREVLTIEKFLNQRVVCFRGQFHQAALDFFNLGGDAIGHFTRRKHIDHCGDIRCRNRHGRTPRPESLFHFLQGRFEIRIVFIQTCDNNGTRLDTFTITAAPCALCADLHA